MLYETGNSFTAHVAHCAENGKHEALMNILGDTKIDLFYGIRKDMPTLVKKSTNKLLSIREGLLKKKKLSRGDMAMVKRVDRYLESSAKYQRRKEGLVGYRVVASFCKKAKHCTSSDEAALLLPYLYALRASLYPHLPGGISIRGLHTRERDRVYAHLYDAEERLLILKRKH